MLKFCHVPRNQSAHVSAFKREDESAAIDQPRTCPQTNLFNGVNYAELILGATLQQKTHTHNRLVTLGFMQTLSTFLDWFAAIQAQVKAGVDSMISAGSYQSSLNAAALLLSLHHRRERTNPVLHGGVLKGGTYAVER